MAKRWSQDSEIAMTRQTLRGFCHHPSGNLFIYMWHIPPDLLYVLWSWILCFHLINKLSWSAPHTWMFLLHNPKHSMYYLSQDYFMYFHGGGIFYKFSRKKNLAVIFQRTITNVCIRQLLHLKSQWSLLSSIIQFLPKAVLCFLVADTLKIIWKSGHKIPSGNSWPQTFMKNLMLVSSQSPTQIHISFWWLCELKPAVLSKVSHVVLPKPSFNSLQASCLVALTEK